MKEIDAERLRKHVHYDPNTGVFTLIEKRGVGDPVAVGGRVDRLSVHGYRTIQLFKFTYPAHRLAWLYVYGQFPGGHIDHINGVKDDNRLFNLRDVSRSVNLQNQRRAKSNNRHGYLGVTPYLNRFKAAIKISGVRIHLGVFDTPEEAAAIYLAMKRKFHEGNTL